MSDARAEATVIECVHDGCGRTQHKWANAVFVGPGVMNETPDGWRIAKCTACSRWSLWINGELSWPAQELAGPSPHPDMPTDVLSLYDEARRVAPLSRRSAGALLRLALQMLVDGLVDGGAKLDTKIGVLVSQGLHPDAQKAMDVLRVIGNNAVHPGQVSLEADDELIPALFSLLNLVVEQVIERPKQIAALYGSLPEGALEAIARRDGEPG